MHGQIVPLYVLQGRASWNGMKGYSVKRLFPFESFGWTHREDKCNVTSIHRLASSIVMLSSGRVLLRSIKSHNATYLVLVIAPKVCGSLCNNYICSRCRCNICSRRRSPVSTTALIFQGYPRSHSRLISPPFFHRALYNNYTDYYTVRI